MALSIPRSQAGVAEEEALAKQEAIDEGKLAEYELGGSAGRRQRSAIMNALPKMVRFRATMQTIGDKTLGNATALTDKASPPFSGFTTNPVCLQQNRPFSLAICLACTTPL